MSRPRIPDRPSRRRLDVGRARGFTLIELMIVVVIIAILASIAIPSYQDSVWKGKRAEAKAAILKALQAEERYYTQANAYLCYPGSSPCTNTPSGAFPLFSADNAANSRYTIAVTATGAAGLCAGSTGIAQCAVVTATVNGSADPKCGTTLAMDTVGNKFPALTGTTAVCWR